MKIENPEKENPSNDRWYSIYKKIVTKNDFTNVNPNTAPPVAAPPMTAPPMTAAPPVQPQPVVQQPQMAPQQYVNTGYTQYPPGPYQNTVAPAGPYMPVPPAGPPGFVPNTEYYVGRYGHKGKTMKVENATYTGVRMDCQEDFCKDCSKKVSKKSGDA